MLLPGAVEAAEVAIEMPGTARDTKARRGFDRCYRKSGLLQRHRPGSLWYQAAGAQFLPCARGCDHPIQR